MMKKAVDPLDGYALPTENNCLLVLDGSASVSDLDDAQPENRRCAWVRRNPGVFRMILLGVALIFSTALLWPRVPDWHLEKLGIDHATLQQLSNQVAGTTGEAEPQPISFDVTVDIDNRNLISADLDAGNLTLTHKDSVLGYATMPAIRMTGMANVRVVVRVTMQVHAEDGKAMMNDLQNNNWQLTVHAEGELPAHVGGVTIPIKAQCEVLANVLEMAKPVLDNPDDLIAERKCSFTLA